MRKVLTVVFYKSQAGNEPVRMWLKALSYDDKKNIGEDIKTVEFAYPIGLPLVRKLDTNLWEVRTRLTNRMARIFFTIYDNYMILLHGIIKKSQKTPLEDLQLAKKRRDIVFTGGMENE